MTGLTTFQDHADAYENAVEASEANGQEQYRLRDVIGFADRRITEMEFDTGVEVSNEWATVERKPNNAELRAAEVSKRLKVHGPYLEAVRDRAEEQRQLNIVVLAENKNADMKRLHMRWMQYETAMLLATAERG